MWSFWVEVNLCLFLSFVHLCIAVGGPVSRGVDGDSINRFNSTTLLWLSQARNLVSNVMCRDFFFFAFSEFSDCWFCWYCWKWWPSLLILSFHNTDANSNNNDHLLSFIPFTDMTLRGRSDETHYGSHANDPISWTLNDLINMGCDIFSSNRISHSGLRQ